MSLDWTKGKRISVFAGSELIAQKDCLSVFNKDTKVHDLITQSFKVKTGRCNGCGDCCGTAGSPFPKKMLADIQSRLKDYKYSTDGPCPLLAEDGCILKGKILFSCASSNCEGWSENCTEVME